MATQDRARFKAWQRVMMLATVALVAACIPAHLALQGERFQNARTASRIMAASIAAELRKEPVFIGHPTPIVVGPTVTLASGEITRSGRELQTFLLLDLQEMLPDRQVARLGAHTLENSTQIITGEVAYEKPPPNKPDEAWFLIKLAFTKGGGKGQGNAVFRVNARNFDPTPSRFFQNSPIFQYSGGTATALPGTTTYQTTLAHLGRIDRGVVAFETADYATSESAFRDAAADDKTDLLALSGIYQSTLAQGKTAEADQALDNLIDAGIRQGSLSFKFLFRVRSPELRDDFEMSKYYSQWLARTANRVAQANQCMTIEGHASRSGTAEFNEKLSLLRAQMVVSILAKANPRLKTRLTAIGHGFNKNIVGSGTDDAKDAVDRRVEFKLHSC